MRHRQMAKTMPIATLLTTNIYKYFLQLSVHNGDSWAPDLRAQVESRGRVEICRGD